MNTERRFLRAPSPVCVKQRPARAAEADIKVIGKSKPGRSRRYGTLSDDFYFLIDGQDR